MKLTKRQLKRIIREEYSRLKRRGLIREMGGKPSPFGTKVNANNESALRKLCQEQMYEWVVNNIEMGVPLANKDEAIVTLADDLGIEDPVDDWWENIDFAFNDLEDVGIIQNMQITTNSWEEAKAILRKYDQK